MADISYVLHDHHRAAGLALIEPDDHFVWLTGPSGILAVFAASATLDDILDCADAYAAKFSYPAASVQPHGTGG